MKRWAAVLLLLAAAPAGAGEPSGVPVTRSDLPAITVGIGEGPASLGPDRFRVFDCCEPSDTILFSGDRMILRLAIGGSVIDREVGGMNNTITMVSTTYYLHKIHALDFADQTRPLTAEEAVVRARELHDWFRSAGLAPEERADIRAERRGKSPLTPADWDALGRLAGFEGRNLGSVHLPDLSLGCLKANIAIVNWGTKDPKSPTVFDDGSGQQFGVQVRIADRSLQDREFAPDAVLAPGQCSPYDPAH